MAKNEFTKGSWYRYIIDGSDQDLPLIVDGVTMDEATLGSHQGMAHYLNIPSSRVKGGVLEVHDDDLDFVDTTINTVAPATRAEFLAALGNGIRSLFSH